MNAEFRTSKEAVDSCSNANHCIRQSVFSTCYLTTVSVWRPCSFDDRMINKHKSVGRTIIGRGKRSIWRESDPVSLCPPESHIT
jgi:hypothetical protein